MSTAQRTTTTVTKEADALDRAIEFTVYGTKDVITLTMQEVRTLIAKPTKTGKLPSQRDIAIFLKTCKARGLNPYARTCSCLATTPRMDRSLRQWSLCLPC